MKYGLAFFWTVVLLAVAIWFGLGFQVVVDLDPAFFEVPVIALVNVMALRFLLETLKPGLVLTIVIHAAVNVVLFELISWLSADVIGCGLVAVSYGDSLLAKVVLAAIVSCTELFVVPQLVQLGD